MLHLHLLLLIGLLSSSISFALPSSKSKSAASFSHTTRKVKLQLAGVDSNIISIFSGCIAGAIGVGASYPFDSIKTKSQNYAAANPSTDGSLGLVGMAKLVLKEEGIGGFYAGVSGVMIGQAFIKALAFSSNAWALQKILEAGEVGGNPTLMQLSTAAAFSGFVTSFLCNPIERVKILMQSDKSGEFKNELDCAQKIASQDGPQGLLFRGLDATLAREIPGYGFYFVVYSVMMRSFVGVSLGHFAPLVCGAAAGMMSWLPVYPIDVVKTFNQNTKGDDESNSNNKNMVQTAIYLYETFGIKIFFDGLTPKMIRAAVNHSVTFFVYELLMDLVV